VRGYTQQKLFLQFYTTLLNSVYAKKINVNHNLYGNILYFKEREHVAPATLQKAVVKIIRMFYITTAMNSDTLGKKDKMISDETSRNSRRRV
jgi:hypothetical protein